jgi:alkylation response protein AidB-like acyl-CoA dehydrogenase
MELDLGPEAAAFREEVRAWIADAAPKGLSEMVDWTSAPLTGGDRSAFEKAERSPEYAQWTKRVLDDGWVCPTWPKKFGGRGLGPVENAVYSEELVRANLPRIRRGFGEGMVGPSIMVHGTEEQQKYFLPRIISAEDVYCQGFSEPGQGSDLAGVTTRGVVDGDELVITGQKIWTSGFYRANMIFIICRTDPDAPKHRGLSYVLTPFKDNNIDARPVRQMTGSAEFGEEFIDGARAPLFNVIGGLNNGWRVAMTTLGHERGGSATTGYLGYQRQFNELAELAREVGRDSEPAIRDRLAWCYSHVQIMRFSGMRLMAQLADGKEPGPEASINKLFWSEYGQAVGELAAELLGANALVRPDGDGYRTSRWQNVFLASRAGTIFSGTSEIQRNIISERALGLPREPQAPSAAKAAGAGAAATPAPAAAASVGGAQ